MNEVDARMRAVDERLPQRFAASTYRPDAWTIRLIGGCSYVFVNLVGG